MIDDSSKDFKVESGEARSLPGSRTNFPVPAPSIEEDDKGTECGTLVKESL
jgi:hypothetical protein